MVEIVIWGVLAIACSMTAGVLAFIKNRDWSAWMAWGFLIPPVVLLFAMLPRNLGPRPRQPRLDEIG